MIASHIQATCFSALTSPQSPSNKGGVPGSGRCRTAPLRKPGSAAGPPAPGGQGRRPAPNTKQESRRPAVNAGRGRGPEEQALREAEPKGKASSGDEPSSGRSAPRAKPGWCGARGQDLAGTFHLGQAAEPREGPAPGWPRHAGLRPGGWCLTAQPGQGRPVPVSPLLVPSSSFSLFPAFAVFTSAYLFLFAFCSTSRFRSASLSFSRFCPRLASATPNPAWALSEISSAQCLSPSEPAPTKTPRSPSLPPTHHQPQ